MSLDIPTLIFVFVAVCLMGAFVMMVGALRRPFRPHFVACALGSLLSAAAVALVFARGSIPDALSICVGNLLLLVAGCIVWCGLAALEGRPARWWAILAGPSAWLAACQIPAIFGDFGSRIAVISSLCAYQAFSIARLLWVRQDEWMSYRRQFSLLCLGHFGFHVLRATYAFVTPITTDLYHVGLVISLSLVEPILLIFGGILLGFGMMHERTEKALFRAASLDGLSGLLNRAAFMSAAADALGKSGAAVPVALLLFDLDRFKMINDNFGHAAGDRVITAFAEVASRGLGARHPLGRVGGEEFAAILVGVAPDTALRIAEGIRRDFTRRRIEHDGKTIAATVSIGMVTQLRPEANLDHLLDHADRALYAAKREGRNRVRLAPVG